MIPMRRHFTRPTRRLVSICISVLFGVILAIYATSSYAGWYSIAHKQASRDLRASLSSALGLQKEPSSTDLDQVKKGIVEFKAKYTTTPCDVSPLIGWQVFIPGVQTIANTCKDNFADSLGSIVVFERFFDFIEHEKKSSLILANAVEATKAPTDYAVASTAWAGVASSYDSSTVNVFQPVENKIKTVSTSISSAYTKIASAMKDENKSALDEALNNLESAYTSIKEIQALAASERQVLILAIADAYDKL